jgi:hypothetical protein
MEQDGNAQRNVNKMGGYSPDQLKQLEKKISKQDVPPSEVAKAMKEGTSAAVSGKVHAHSGGAADNNSGEQGLLKGEFAAIRGSVLNVSNQYSGEKKPRPQGSGRHSAEGQRKAEAKKVAAATNRKKDKHVQWHADNPTEFCTRCKKTGPI